MKEPSKNHDVWVPVLFVFFYEVRFGFLHIFLLSGSASVQFLAKPGFWFVLAGFGFLPISTDNVVRLLLLLWLAPLRVRSATGCQQPPEWSVLGQVDCVGRRSMTARGSRGRSAPSSSGSSQWSLLIYRR